MRAVVPVAAGAVLLMASGCSAAGGAKKEPAPRFQQPAVFCGATSRIADGGASVSFDTKGKDDVEGDDLEKVTCFLDQLKVPTYVKEHIDSTRALDGQQTDEWNGYKVRWTYHPDNGLVLTVIDTRRLPSATK